MKYLYLFLLIFSIMGSTCESANRIYSAQVQAELLTDVSSIVQGETFLVGLRMVMDDGWHIYWRNSGDSGLATNIQWNLPEGFKDGKMHWPYPKRFDYNAGLSGYGYNDEVILLTEITAPLDLKDGQTSTIKAKISWLSCEKVCVPGKVDLVIELTTQLNQALVKDSIHQRFIKEKLKWPIDETQWHMTAVDKNNVIIISMSSKQSVSFKISDIAFFPYRNDIIDHAGDQILKDIESGYELVIPKSVLLNEKIQNIEGVIVSREGWKNGDERRGLFVEIPVN